MQLRRFNKNRYRKGDEALRQLYIPRNVSDYLAEEHFRMERDKQIVRNFQRRQAEQSAYRIRLQFHWFARLCRWLRGVLAW